MLPIFILKYVWWYQKVSLSLHSKQQDNDTSDSITIGNGKGIY